MLRAMRCLVAEMNILESMTPDTYQIIRRSLGNGSGQESPGYNAIRLSADAMEAALDRALTRRNLRLVDVYKVGAQTAEDLKRVCEQFVDIDELFQTWLYVHYQMVRRIIGVDRSIKALDGLPTQVLAGRMTLPLFRKLWEVRVEMTNAWKRDGGYAVGTARQPGSPPPSSAGPAPESPHASHYEAPAAAPHQYGAPAAAPPYSAPPAQALAAAAQAPVHSPAEALAAAAAAAPAQAPPEDPWSKPEPPTSRRDFNTSSVLPPSSMPIEDPWSRPEPPTSRRDSELPQDTAAAGGAPQASEPSWGQPPKTGGSY
jgi:tryptophan 2,3-dioxygenase